MNAVSLLTLMLLASCSEVPASQSHHDAVQLPGVAPSERLSANPQEPSAATERQLDEISQRLDYMRRYIGPVK